MYEKKTFYVLREYTKRFPISGFVFKKYMTIEENRYSKVLDVYEDEDEAFRKTSEIRDCVITYRRAVDGVQSVTEYSLWKEGLDENGNFYSRLID